MDTWLWLRTTQAMPDRQDFAVSETPTGRYFKLNPERAAEILSGRKPYDARVESTSGGNMEVSIYPGYLSGHAPTIAGTPITDVPAPTITVSQTGTQVIYQELQVSLTAMNDFVYKADFVAVAIDTAASVPADDKSGGFYYQLIATYVDGKKVPEAQPVITNQTYYISDTLTGESKANCSFQ